MNGDYYGLPTTILTNNQLTVEFLSQAGPRIVRLYRDDIKDNLFVELPDQHWETSYGEFYPRGGHRLWHAPESKPRSYIPDNEGLVIEKTTRGLRLTAPVEKLTDIQKSIEIHLVPGRPVVILTHRLQNLGIWPVELSPWGITQMPLGGVAVLPQTKNALEQSGLLPNRNIVLWPYTSWEDTRLQPHDDFIIIQAEGKTPPVKVGYADRAGWIGYLNQGVFFVKKSMYQAGAVYPDFGSSAECYCDNNCIEIETLAPLTHLETGQSVEHVETWELYPAPGVSTTHAGIRDFVHSLGLP
jgi:hypothetical protein